MSKRMLINVEEREKRVAVLKDGVLEEFYVERADSERLVGNIYRGIVKSILPGIQAAFVEIGLEKNGFLYVKDIVSPPQELEEEVGRAERKFSFAKIYPLEKIRKRKPPVSRVKDRPDEKKVSINALLKKNQQVLVQVIKDPIGTKGVRLTTHITLPGRYLVLMPCDSQRGISKRIEDEKERERLKSILEGLKLPERGMGAIVRTAGEGFSSREFERDARYLTKMWNRIGLDARRKKAPVLIHQDFDLILRVVRDLFTDDYTELVVDTKAEFHRINRFLNRFNPKLKKKVVFYESGIPMFEKYNLTEVVEGLYKRKVELKCGGYIVIEPTEGLIAIDVNTGKFAGRKSLEETALRVNLEAAGEIARQIKLRDVGGIIVVDFIDMELQEYCRKVTDRFRKALKSDRARTTVLTISELGLVELTRQRMRKSLESTFYEVCPHCQGRGSVKSVRTVCIEVLREVRHFLGEKEKAPAEEIKIIVNPRVAFRLLNNERTAISRFENKYKCSLIVEADPDFHVEKIKIAPVSS